jgi:hypothetical protein
VEISALARVAAGRELQVDIRILAVIGVVPRSDDQELDVGVGSILKAMPVTIAGPESCRVAGA